MEQIPLFKVFMSPTVDEPLLNVLHSGYVGEGPRVIEFENRLKNIFKNKHCLALNSGTAGLQLALALLKIKNKGHGKGGNILTSGLSCFATIAPILSEGFDIKWADIQRDTLNIDPESIKKNINSETRAILFVHWGGYPADLEEIKAIASEYNIPVIEDAAHCFKSTYKDTIIGDCTYSDYCMLSFQAIKFLTTIDGGCLFVNSEEDYELGKLLRWFGISREGPMKDMRCAEDIIYPGYKMQMNDVDAIIGLSNLERIDKNLRITKMNVEAYRDELKDFSGVTLIQNGTDRTSSNWIFTILVNDAIGFARMMGEKGIMVSKVHSRLDIHSCVKEYAERNLPNLDYVEDKRICIPVGWWVSTEQREYIIDTIRGGW